MEIITLPYKFEPRWYQTNFLKQWDSGIQRMILVGHRRLGKDKMVFANLSKKMMERVGTYFYFLPTYNQARKVIWNGADGNGFRFLDHFPKEIVKKKNEADMIIELTNGSILQMVGADNIDRIVGTNPIGVVFSEYSIMKPEVWDFISPILAENGGWAVFVYTPRGQNHAYKLMQNAQKNAKWHVEVLKVSYTNAVKEEDLLEQKMGMSQALYNQEYECFPTGTDIITDTGVKDISEIQVGDRVLTHTNRYRKVLKTFNKEYNGDLVRIKSFGNNKDILCTPNHPIRTTIDGVNYKWTKAEDITKKDKVTIPKPLQGKSPIIAKRLARLIAWYIAEGSFSGNTLSFSLNSSEIEYQKEIQDDLKFIGVSSKLIKSKNSNCTVIAVNNTELGEFMVQNCGTGAKNKRIPFSLIAGHEDIVFETLNKGDGCDIDKKRNLYTTISKTLAYQVQLLTNMLGYTSSVSLSVKEGKGVILGRNVNLSDKYSVRVNRYRKGKALKMKSRKYSVTCNIQEIDKEEFNGIVYNFEVETDNSYVANSKVVHNCDFTENASAVFKDIHKRTYPAHEWQHNDEAMYKLGADLAKANDFTVITAIDLSTFRVAPQDSFNQIDYTLQKAKIEGAFYRYNKPLITMDATGVGQPIVDDLLNKGINIDPFTFTYNSRNELLVNLQILLEQDKIRIPDEPELLEQLEAAFWDTTAQGRTRITVPEDRHDDRLMSLALACWQLPIKPITQRMMTQSTQAKNSFQPFYESFGF